MRGLIIDFKLKLSTQVIVLEVEKKGIDKTNSTYQESMFHSAFIMPTNQAMVNGIKICKRKLLGSIFKNKKSKRKWDLMEMVGRKHI